MCNQGRIGELYKLLQKLGTREIPEGLGHTLTEEEFKNQIEGISRERYEEPPWVLDNTVKRVKDRRNDREAEEENEKLNRVPSEEGIHMASKEIREDRRDVSNYRGVCLRAMGSQILAKIIAKRVGVWAETLGQLDETQAGFRKGRSTADMVQVLIRMEEDIQD